MQKTSIRFFEDVPVRAVWDAESSKWWFCAMDIAEALTKTSNPRVYWATIKRRNAELIAICKQLKLKARDGKFYSTDVVDDAGLNTVIALIPSKKTAVFSKWMKDMETSVDEKSKQKAYELFDSGFVDNIEVGTVKSRIFRARKRLCTFLIEDGNIPDFTTSGKTKGGEKYAKHYGNAYVGRQNCCHC